MRNVNVKAKCLLTTRALAISLIAALVLMRTAVGEISRTGLVGEWHFDGDTKDSSGYGNDKSVYGRTVINIQR